MRGNTLSHHRDHRAPLAAVALPIGLLNCCPYNAKNEESDMAGHGRGSLSGLSILLPNQCLADIVSPQHNVGRRHICADRFVPERLR